MCEGGVDYLHEVLKPNLKRKETDTSDTSDTFCQSQIERIESGPKKEKKKGCFAASSENQGVRCKV